MFTKINSNATCVTGESPCCVESVQMISSDVNVNYIFICETLRGYAPTEKTFYSNNININ